MPLHSNSLNQTKANRIYQVNSRTSIPVVSVATTSTISALMALIGIGSSVAFNDLVSITVAGLFSSYLMAISLLLWRRVTGSIMLASEAIEDSKAINTANTILKWGPFKMPELIGIIVNAASIAFTVIIFLFSFWPTAQPVTPSTMNYTCLLFGAVVLFSWIWYYVYAHGVYKGPRVEIDQEYSARG